MDINERIIREELINQLQRGAIMWGIGTEQKRLLDQAEARINEQAEQIARLARENVRLKEKRGNDNEH